MKFCSPKHTELKVNGVRRQAQSGAVLIVSLVILLIVTLIGVASMRSSNLELKMAISARDRAASFEAAEAALSTVEATLYQRFSLDDLLGLCNPGDANCFNDQCLQGLCFTGEFPINLGKNACSLVGAGDTVAEQPWRDESNNGPWNNNQKHVVETVRTTSADGTVENIDVKYVIEFLCFVPHPEESIADSAGNNGVNSIPLYRVTVRSSGQGDRATVMLQSTFQASERI